MTAIHYRGSYVDNVKVNKGDVRAGFRDFVPLSCTIAQLRLIVTQAHLCVLIDGKAWALDPADTTSVDDGVSVIVSLDGYRYKPEPVLPAFFTPEAYGAAGDGVADDSAELQVCYTAAAAVTPKGAVLLTGIYNWASTSTLSVPDNVHTISFNAASIIKGANCLLIAPGNNCTFRGVLLDGNGGTYSGGGVSISSGADNDQKFYDFTAVDFDGYALECSPDCGLRLLWGGGTAYRTTTTQPAIRFAGGGGTETAGERKLIGLQAAGGHLVDTAGSQNTSLTDCSMVNMTFGADSLKSRLIGCRFATGGSALTVHGQDHSLVAPVVAGDLALDTDAVNVSVSGEVLVGNLTDAGSGNHYIRVVGGLGASAQVLVSNGAPNAASFQTAPIGGGGTGATTAYGADDNLSKHGADVASASTINLTTATGNLVDVTGTTTITAITLAEGLRRTVRFTGALVLTHGASLVLPGAANITTVAGDFAIFRGYGSGVVRCVAYTRADGTPVVTVPVARGGTGQTTEAEAIGELTEALSEVTAPVPSADFAGGYEGSSDTGKKWSLETLGNHIRSNSGNQSGRYIGSEAANPSTVTTLVVTADRLYAVPFAVSKKYTWTGLSIDVTSAAGTLARLGIFKLSEGVPTALVLDAGTVSTASTGIKTATISEALEAGWYALVAVFDNAPTIRAVSSNTFLQSMQGLAALGTTDNGLYMAHAFAALPSSWGTSVWGATAIPLLVMTK